jgi:hypothetical protein
MDEDDCSWKNLHSIYVPLSVWLILSILSGMIISKICLALEDPKKRLYAQPAVSTKSSVILPGLSGSHNSRMLSDFERTNRINNIQEHT